MESTGHGEKLLGRWNGSISSYFTDLLKTNQSPHNSFSYSFFFFFNFHDLILTLQQLLFKATYGWCDEAKVVNTEIMGYQCCRCVLSHVSLLFPRPLHLPLRTDVPLGDRRPLFVQTQACPVLSCAVLRCTYVCVCVCASACRPLHAYLRLLRNVQEITGKTELNIM